MYKVKLFIVTFFIVNTIAAQHSTTHTNLLWFNYNNSIILNPQWSIANDVQLRTRDWANEWSQFALRTAVNRKLNKQFTVSAGFAWFGTVRNINGENLIANEWRPWEEISFQSTLGKNSLLQRLRLEQRFLQKIINGRKVNEVELRDRLRYRIEAGFPLFKKQQLAIHFGNEVMINVDHLADNLLFDQNRLFAIVNVKLSGNTIFQFQYLKIFQWQAANKIMDHQNVLRFSIHQQFIKR